MNKKVLTVLQYAFFFGLGVFLVWWSLRNVSDNDWKEIKNAFLTVRVGLILPVALALLASHYSRALRWRILMEPLGYKPRISNTYIAVLIGYLANLAVPRLGEILKCTLLARYEKVPADKLVGTIVAERAFDVICLLLVMAIAFFTQTDIIGEYLSNLLNNIFKNKAGQTDPSRLYWLAGIGLVALGAFWFALKKFSHFSIVQKFRKILEGIWHGLTSVRYIKKKGWFFFHTVFIWLMYLASVQIGMFAMQDTAHYGIKPSLSVLSTGSIAMILTPSGIGAYPLFIQETMLLYGLKESLGIAFGWLMWTVQFFLILISGFAAFGLLPYFNKTKTNAPAPKH